MGRLYGPGIILTRGGVGGGSAPVRPIRVMGLTAVPVYPPYMNHLLRHHVRLIQFNPFVFVKSRITSADISVHK